MSNSFLFDGDMGLLTVSIGAPFGKPGYVLTSGEFQFDGLTAVQAMRKLDEVMRDLLTAREAIRDHEAGL